MDFLKYDNELQRLSSGLNTTTLAVLALCFSYIITGCNKNINDVRPANLKNVALNGSYASMSGNTVANFSVDTTTLLRNPLVGWMLYDDDIYAVANASNYWSQQGTAATQYGSIFYVRWRWSDMEPAEGQYAWNTDANFRALIQGALDRGLKLAFRIYTDGQNNAKNATPDWVKAAGAIGYASTNYDGTQTNWTPYADDPVFQKKYADFVAAFAAKFDNPAQVDFVDGFNLGWWGEGQHIQFTNNNNSAQVWNWIVGLYGTSFKKVPLAITFDSQMTESVEASIAVNQYHYILRRDGLGSGYFTIAEKQWLAAMWPNQAFMAESCYYGASTDNSYQPWSSDAYDSQIHSWQAYRHLTTQDALTNHANTLDLRTPLETSGWTAQNLSDVKNFIAHGGYRLYPSEISYPASISNNVSFQIGHVWQNTGVGVCPNNNARWNYKYKIAFALINPANQAVVTYFIDKTAEPSKWLKGSSSSYTFTGSITGVAAGQYQLAVAIVDSANNYLPGIKLAVSGASYINNWMIVGNVSVNNLSSEIVSGATYKIVSAVNNTSVLDVAKDSTANGTKVVLWSDNGGLNQKWIVTSVGNGYYKLQSALSTTKVLDVYNGASINGTQVEIWNDNGGSNQQWQIKNVGNGYYSLVPASTTTSQLDIYTGDSTNGTKVEIWASNTSNAQKFQFIKQ